MWRGVINMTLIKCIECGCEISDKSDKCIKCGCPTELSIPRNEENTCLINGHPYDLSEFVDTLTNPNVTVAQVKEINEKLRKKTNFASSFALCYEIMKTKKVPKEYKGKTLEDVKAEEAKKVHCPRCGSTYVEKRRYAPLPYMAAKRYWYCKNCHSRFDV